MMNSTMALKYTWAAEDNERFAYRTIKRMMDVVLSLVGLAIFSPVMLLIAVAIRLDDPGPALFKHARTGKDRRKNSPPAYTGSERRKKNLFGEQFVLWKFRTMVKDADERYPELFAFEFTKEEFESLYVGQPIPGGNPDEQDDPRLTRVGRWLRKTSLDELPNFINVLIGDMSVVGPRPDIWQHIRYYPEGHREKLKIKPGVTCVAQTRGRGMLTFLKTNEYDLEYYRNRSLFNDLRIILKTVKSVLLREGAY